MLVLAVLHIQLCAYVDLRKKFEGAGGVEDTFPRSAYDKTFAASEETKSNMIKLLRVDVGKNVSISTART